MTTNVMDGTDEFSILLHLSYPALRRAAMAGAELAKAVEETELSDLSECMATEGKLEITHIAVANVNNNYWRNARDAAISAYRSAIEEKNV